MTLFFRLVDEDDKEPALEEAVHVRGAAIYEVDANIFGSVPGSPFAYWISEQVRSLFLTFEKFKSSGRIARKGLTTSDDKRYVRLWWEIPSNGGDEKWAGYAKGGTSQKFYSDLTAYFAGTGPDAPSSVTPAAKAGKPKGSNVLISWARRV